MRFLLLPRVDERMEIPEMPIILAHLMARTPTEQDFDSIAELVAACDMSEDGMTEKSTRDLASGFQQEGIHLERDAWVILNGRRQLAGFACIWHRDYEEFSIF